MFKYNTSVRLNHTDAAGIIFFGQIYVLTHEAYEEMLKKIGTNIHYILESTDFLLPYVHSEADYKKMLRAGDDISIEVDVENIGTTSFTLIFRVFNSANEEAAVVRTVSVSTSKTTLKKIPIPGILRAGLERVKTESI